MPTVTKPRADIPIAYADLMLGNRVVRIECKANPEWDRFLELLLNRAGGTTGTGTPELELSAFEDAGIEETKAQLAAARDEFGQVPSALQPLAPDDVAPVAQQHVVREDPSGDVSALREAVAALAARVQALEQRP